MTASVSAGYVDHAQVPLHDLSTSLGMEEMRHIYLHIPFCARICPYCAFYKERADPAQAQRFCEAVLLELDQHRNQLALQPETIFFGGGTPTALSIAQLELILRGFRERIDLSRLVEWTIEANPGSVSERKAAALHAGGITRVSLGVQSWDDALLDGLGREHNAPQAETSFKIFRDTGFTNISVDLMFGIPGQAVEHWQASLEKTIALRPEKVRIAAAAPSDTPDNHYRGRVADLLYMGDVTVYRVETPGGNRIEALLANSQSGRAKFFEVGDAVEISWHVDAGHFIAQ